MGQTKILSNLNSLACVSNCADLDSPHTVQLYAADAFLLESLSRFIGSALASGDAAVVIATAAHRQGLAEGLKERGLDVAVALRQGRYVELDAVQTLSQFMHEGWPDAARFSDFTGKVIERARGGREHDSFLSGLLHFGLLL